MTSIQHVPPSAPPDFPAPGDTPPRLYYPYPPAPRQGGPGLVTAVLLAMLLLVLVMTAVFVLAAVSTMGAGGRAIGEAGQRAGETARAAGETATRMGQDVQDRLDASHPPRGALDYDVEIEELVKLGVGQPLADGGRRSFTVSEIKSRSGEDRPELARYAVLHSELRRPNETKVFGLTVHRDSEPRDDYLYVGEAFRIGGKVYKVNWISPERQQLALVELRNPDRVGGAVKFVYD